MEAIEELRQGDKIVIKVEGMPTVVIDGDIARGFFEAAVNQMIGLLTTIADGRLEAAMGRINANLRPHVQDLIDDFREAGREGHFIRISNTDDLGQEAERFGVSNLSVDETGFTVGVLQSDTTDIDGNPSTTQFHQIYFDMSRITEMVNNIQTANSRIRQYDSLEVQLFHELFHIVEGDASIQAELTRLGSTASNHDYMFNRAAAELHSVIRRLDHDLTLSSTSFPGQLHMGTAGNDVLQVSLAAGEVASIDTGAGNDFVSLPLSQSVVSTGAGDDALAARAGTGRIIWLDEGGTDTLQIDAAPSLSKLAIERFGGWTYIGVLGPYETNKSASELSSVVLFDDALAPETISVGGQSYSLSYIHTLANSKPDFYHAPQLSFQAPFYGGLIANLPGIDLMATPSRTPSSASKELVPTRLGGLTDHT